MQASRRAGAPSNTSRKAGRGGAARGGKHDLRTRESAKLNATFAGIGAAVESLRIELVKVEEEIRADGRNLTDYDAQLARLDLDIGKLNWKLKRDEKFLKDFESGIKPLANSYDAIAGSLGGIYDQAKGGHKRGIELLKQEFGYHPAFKRPGDNFQATAFTPK